MRSSEEILRLELAGARSPTSRPRRTHCSPTPSRRAGRSTSPPELLSTSDEAESRRRATEAGAGTRRGRARDAAEPVDGAPTGAETPRLRRSRPARPWPGYPAPVPDRLPAPGPSFLREQPVRIGSHTFRAGHGAADRRRPTAGGWRSLWVADDDGVVSFRDVAPAAGPPPDPPLGRLGSGRQRRPVRADPRGRRAGSRCGSA